MQKWRKAVLTAGETIMAKAEQNIPPYLEQKRLRREWDEIKLKTFCKGATLVVVLFLWYVVYDEAGGVRPRVFYRSNLRLVIIAFCGSFGILCFLEGIILPALRQRHETWFANWKKCVIDEQRKKQCTTAPRHPSDEVEVATPDVSLITERIEAQR